MLTAKHIIWYALAGTDDKLLASLFPLAWKFDLVWYTQTEHRWAKPLH